jgi:hypothetical protein
MECDICGEISFETNDLYPQQNEHQGQWDMQTNNTMEQNPSSEANSHSASQEISTFY